jgi:RimJ/RimL family protein N-acetyltransferase
MTAARRLSPEEAPHHRTSAQLRDMHPPWRMPVAREDELVLEPLREDHAPALAWQYRDPTIAEKTLLPPIAQPCDASDWVAARLTEQIEAYALVHREHGFVGSCELTSRGTETFLCLWIGTDWQGRGFGRSLVALACRHAFYRGTDIVLTAAYDSNEASLRALRGNGFADVAMRALDPDHDRTFLYLTEEPMAMGEVKARLLRFSENADTGLQFPPEPEPPTQD